MSHRTPSSNEPRPIGEIMEDILAELRLMNGIIVNDIVRKDSVQELLSINESAAFCGVSRQTIHQWIDLGKLHKVERNCRTGILKSELVKISQGL